MSENIASDTSHLPAYGKLTVEILPDLEAYRAVYEQICPSDNYRVASLDFVYQSVPWIKGWQETLGQSQDVKPLLLAVYAGDKPVVLLPLGCQKRGSSRIAQFLSQSNSNQNTGVWDRAFLKAQDPAALQGQLASLLRPTLREAGVDLLHLGYVPKVFDGLPLPLPFSATLTSMNPVFRGTMREDFDALFTSAFGKSSRKTTLRKEKALIAEGGFRVYQCETPEEIERGMTCFLEQRQARHELTGIPNAFGTEAGAAFLKKLTGQSSIGVTGAKASPLMSIWCLEVAGKIRATYLCLNHGRCLIGYTNSIAHDELTPKSPGVILLKQMLGQLCGKKLYDTLDLGLGDERYKHGWTEPQPLRELFLPVTAKGQVSLSFSLVIAGMKAQIRGNARLWSLVRKFRSFRAKAGASPAD